MSGPSDIPRPFTVTITGADDAVAIADLVALSREFPFVEWGILASYTRAGSPRYPTIGWIADLNDAAGPAMQLALHACGQVASEIMAGRCSTPFVLNVAEGTTRFRRVQINGYEPGALWLLLNRYHRGPLWILQARTRDWFHDCVREVWSTRISSTSLRTAAASVLFDRSGGAGLYESPAQWPDAGQGVLVGYAGGIVPEFAANALREASKLGGFWIDMESGVRDEHDAFDLDRVREVLENTRDVRAALGIDRWSAQR